LASQNDVGAATGEHTAGRTGEGDAAEWTLVADASAEGGRAIAQIVL
jgi:hypothetical protein